MPPHHRIHNQSDRLHHPELADARGVKLDVCATQLLNETARADVAGGSVQTVERPISARVSAIFQIMTNLAHAESAERYLNAIRAVHPEINQAFMRKPKARNLSSQGRDYGALQVLLVEPILHREFRSMPDLANEMAAVVKRKTRGAGVDRVLAAISGSDGRPWLQKTHIAASQRIAQTSSLRGQVGEALSRMKQVEGRIDDDLAPQVRVNAMIFHADYLRAAGYLREAQEKIRYAMTDAPFTQLATKTYTVLFSAHSALCLGEVERALAELTFAEQLATPTGDSSGSSRIRSALLGSIAHVRSNALMALGDFERAHCSLDPARSLADGGWTHKLGAPLTELHELALLRARRDFRACIDEAQRLVSRRGGLRDYPQLALAAELISTEVAYFELGDLTEQRTKTMLEDIAMRFRARGYRSAAGRASISSAKVTGDPISAAVVEEWDKLGWQREIQWLDGETETPPHWVLPF